MKYITWILALLCLAPAATAKENPIWDNSTLKEVLRRGELRVGLEPGYVPFEMLDDDGNLVGFDVEIATAMADAMGVKLKLIQKEWADIMPALLAEEVDIVMSGMTITPERNLWINFSDSYMSVGQTILLKRDLKGEIKSYKDLDHEKYTVATKPGTTAHDAVKKHMPKARIALFEKEAAGVLEVRIGRADAWVYDLPFNAIYYTRNQKKLVFLDKPFTTERLGWAIRKGDPDFLNWLNHFLAQIKADGRYEAAYQKWFKKGAWMNGK